MLLYSVIYFQMFKNLHWPASYYVGLNDPLLVLFDILLDHHEEILITQYCYHIPVSDPDNDQY